MCLSGVFLFSLLSLSCLAQEADELHGEYDAILKVHVSGGLVDYRSLRQKPERLIRYLSALDRVPEKDFNKWTDAEQLAFLINIYNAATLKLIIDNYPVKSIKDIGGWFSGPWKQKVVPLFGRKLTLNHLEHEIIRKQYREPRIHMALVCAAKGCPPLRPEAYSGEKLNSQLDDQARIYLRSPAGLQIDRRRGTASISAIFKWFADDFASIEKFVEKYSGENLSGMKIKHLDYDWSLNDKN